MNKGTHFNGQPMYGQLISLLDKHENLKFSREKKGERYVKHFDAYQHLVVMIYAVIFSMYFLPLLKPSLSHIARYVPSFRLQKRLKIHEKNAQLILLPLLKSKRRMKFVVLILTRHSLNNKLF